MSKYQKRAFMNLTQFSSKSTLFKLAVLVVACMSASAHANLINFGEPNTHALTQAMANHSVHVVQVGDSHTAGDTMTDALRSRLQGAMGDGGMGWAMPMYFSGQRMARFSYDNVDFLPISSRNNHSEYYTLGGLIAKPKVNGASLTLKPKKGAEPAQRIWVSMRQQPTDGRFTGMDAYGRRFVLEVARKDGTWQMVSVDVNLPFTIYNDNATGSAIGGWWAFNPSGQGAVVSALGINGAQLSHWDRWSTQAWQNELATIRPTLIILAYGTNEAYNGVSGERVRATLTETIRQIRTVSPRSAVMVMGSPEALKSTTTSCGTRPATLTDVQTVQRQVAQTERTLYWDWQGAMGGSCSMKSWINRGLASKDGVHFSQSGYTRLGNELANELLALSSQIPMRHSDAIYPNGTYPANHSTNNSNDVPSINSGQDGQGRGFIRIERAN
ncbi:hypothetical protein E6P70_01865 [Moraxella nonliquefaciens]|nr:hypothetical protein [Moraxella nonliquefaciens]